LWSRQVIRSVGPANTLDGEEKWRGKMELKELENEVLKLSIEDRGEVLWQRSSY
jgi:hypothetical protein